MGGLWVDYNLMTTIPGLFAVGEANFSDHGANRLGASALMQGLADGYFIAPYTIADFIASTNIAKVDVNHDAFKESMNQSQDRLNKLLNIKGKKTVTEFHRQVGKIVWDEVGMSRSGPRLEKAIRDIQNLRAEFWENVNVPGSSSDLNQSLEHANRVADFLEFGELMARDALSREESCGCHFREEYQTPDNEAKRDDVNGAYVAVWEYKGDNVTPQLHKESLSFEYVKPTQRNYK
jgi:succinate dehydrogenase / fumarate reductase flavoprotein subunit